MIRGLFFDLGWTIFRPVNVLMKCRNICQAVKLQLYKEEITWLLTIKKNTKNFMCQKTN